MNRRAVALACVAAGALFALEGGAAELATESPVATIATLQAGLIAAAKPTIEERYRALEPLIVATHDLPYIAEFALRRQWPALTEGQRQRFVAAFQRLSVMTYAARFGNVAPDAFRALEAKEPDAGGRAQVATAI
jgi:phospholipid transport system substrate-binding protein